MIESNKRVCRVCQQEKLRILDGKYPDEKNKRWVDETQRQWSGKKCPDCHVKATRESMRKGRAGKVE